MELVKKHIHMNRRRNSVMTQITLDDDFNVPDSMDDVEQMILDSGEIQIETVKNLGGRVTVGGKLNFRILYRRPDGQLMTSMRYCHSQPKLPTYVAYKGDGDKLFSMMCSYLARG